MQNRHAPPGQSSANASPEKKLLANTCLVSNPDGQQSPLGRIAMPIIRVTTKKRPNVAFGLCDNEVILCWSAYPSCPANVFGGEPAEPSPERSNDCTGFSAGGRSVSTS
jgi:hypothetical protein